MITHEHLEAQLKTVNFQLEGGGEHLDDERIAHIGGGAEPSGAECAHLSHCDLCIDLLVALGEGLEAFAAEVELGMSPVSAHEPARRPARRPGRWVGVGVFFAAAIALAAGGWVLSTRTGAERDVARAGPGAEVIETAPPAPPVLPEAAPTPPTAGVTGRDPILSTLSAQIGSLSGLLGPLWARTLSSIPAVEWDRPKRADDGAGEQLVVGRLQRRHRARSPRRQPIDGPPSGYGHLRLNATPPAQVFIGGRIVGWTPIIDLRLPEGPQDVRLVYDSPLAAAPEERFRVVISKDERMRVVRKNVRARE